MSLRTLPLVALALALLAGGTHAQTAPPATGGAAQAGERHVARRAPSGGPLGFNFGTGPVSILPGGALRAANPPTVRLVVAGSNAQRAGLMVGDSIVTVNGHDAREIAVFHDRRPGTRYVLRVRRGGEDRVIAFTVAERQ